MVLRRSMMKFCLVSCIWQQLFCLPLHAVGANGTGEPLRPAARNPGHHNGDRLPLAVEYTGALFGYYRSEPADYEKIGTRPIRPLPAVEDFVNERKGDSRLLLGMGDNFAPEFGAAIQLNGLHECRNIDQNTGEDNFKRPRPNRYGRDQAPALYYKLSGWVAPLAHCDNVTNFLMRAGYRAIVPGREDFLYSATWLQSIALLLMDRKEEEAYNSNRERKLNLLAANLRVSGDKKSCPLFFSSSAMPPIDKKIDPAVEAVKTRCVQSEGEAIPEEIDWVERLDITLKPRDPNETPHDVNEEMKEGAARSPYVRRQLLINQMSMTLVSLKAVISGTCDKNHQESPQCLLERLKKLTTTDGYKISGRDVLPDEEALEAVDSLQQAFADAPIDIRQTVSGLATVFDKFEPNHAATAKPQADENYVFDETTRKAIRQQLLRTIAQEEREIGYTFADNIVGERLVERTLVIGVVGRETMGAISPSNLELPNEIWKLTVQVQDPRRVAKILLRAANLTSLDEHKQIAKTIIMAQMPRTEAEELGAHIRADLSDEANAIGGRYPVDLILSEAQPEHASPAFDIGYDSVDITPVLTPHPAFDRKLHDLVQPISTAFILANGSERRLSNLTPTTARAKPDKARTTVDLLNDELAKLRPKPVTSQLNATTAIDFLLRELQLSSHADVVMLERRDLYLDYLPEEYSQYGDYCHDDDDRCRLHVALDRILWKGDFSQRVMVSGKDLKDALKAAGDQAIAQRSLAARDTSDQWLVTFGVVTSDQTNLTRLEANSIRFGVPWSDECHENKTQTDPQYCVNGSTIADDAGYWISTSDHVANDAAIYTMLRNESSGYHQLKWVKLVYDTSSAQDPEVGWEGMFLTDELTDNLQHQGGAKAESFIQQASKHTGQSTALQHLQQDRSLLHLDYAKLVAGFSLRHPDGGNAAAANFQGVTDTRASQPTQQELDLESVNRFSADVKTPKSVYAFSLGAQSDAEYDRSVLGNLTNKPINASYAVNSFTTGGFIQKRLPFWGDSKTTGDNWASRELPRTLFVLYPYQYQRQINGNFVFLNYTAGNGELTLPLPVVSGHAYKAGFRHELTSGRRWGFDRGSYSEAGWQYVVQNDVARSLTLTTASTGQSKTCFATQKQTLPECFSSITINSTTTAAPPDLVSQSTTGLYWDIHLQRSLPKGGNSTNALANLTIDTKGDFFGERQSSLATQTRYDIPINVSINFPVLRNLSLSPTYGAFLFENQVGQQSILINTFAISAKWYYDRDSGIPFGRMFLFKGPASQDQTKTAKMK